MSEYLVCLRGDKWNLAGEESYEGSLFKSLCVLILIELNRCSLCKYYGNDYEDIGPYDDDDDSYGYAYYYYNYSN
jgi:hypothetical protein